MEPRKNSILNGNTVGCISNNPAYSILKYANIDLSLITGKKDGVYLATGNSRCYIKIWNCSTDKCVKTFEKSKNTIGDLIQLKFPKHKLLMDGCAGK